MKNRITISREFGVLLIISSLILISAIGTAHMTLPRISKNGNTNESTINHEPMKGENTQNREVLFSEGFEWGFPPTGWTQIITNTGFCDSYPQYAAHWDQFSENPHNGTKSAYVWWDYQHQDEWLITPAIDLTGIPNGELIFWSYGYEGSTHNDHYYVKLSTDGGATWIILLDLSSFPPDQGWNSYTDPYTIDLTSYADQIIQLAWQAVSPENDGIWYFWCIDDIVVTGGDNTPPVTTCTITGAYDKTITLTATDDMSGVDYINYKLDNGAWTQYTESINVYAVGDHIVYYYSVDNAGNVEEQKNQAFTIELPVTITITGGVGVSAIIKNVGTINLTDLHWSMALDGKLIFVGKTRSGTIASLAPGQEITIKDTVLGFGKTNIAVGVESEEAVVSGRVLLFFVLGIK